MIAQERLPRQRVAPELRFVIDVSPVHFFILANKRGASGFPFFLFFSGFWWVCGCVRSTVCGFVSGFCPGLSSGSNCGQRRCAIPAASCSLKDFFFWLMCLGKLKL